MKQPILFLISLQFLFLFQIIKKVGFLVPTFFLYVNFQCELLTTKSRELHKITEKASYLLRSLILKSLFFLASPQIRHYVYTATLLSVYYILNSNILYSKISNIVNFKATFSMLVLFISWLKPRVFLTHLIKFFYFIFSFC